MPDEEIRNAPKSEGPLEEETIDYEAVAGSVVRSGLWSVLGQTAALGAALVATPFTIRLLGPARYGLLSLLQSVQSWMGLADFGMTTASTRFAGERHAQGDTVGEATSTWTAAAITTGAMAVLATTVAFEAPLVVKSILHVRGTLVGPGETAVRLAAAACVAAVLGGTLNTQLIVRLKWRDLTLIAATGSVGGIVVVPLALAVFGGGVITSTIVTLAFGILTSGLLLIVAIKLQPMMKHPRFSRSAATKLLRYGAALTVAGVASIPLSTADRLFLAHYRTTTTVAYYVVAWRLATLLTVVPMAICQPLFPGFIKLQGSGQADSMRSLYKQALQGLFLLLTPSMLLLAFIARPFLSLWAGRVYGVHSTRLFYVMVVGVWFDSAGWLPAYFLSLDNMKEFARLRVIEVFPYLAAVAVLTIEFGPMGTAMAWAGRLVIDSIVLFTMARRAGGMTISPLSANRARSVAFPLALGTILLLLSQVTASLAVRAGYAIVCSGIYSVLLWRQALTQRERDGLRALAPSKRIVRSTSAS